jgi:hypothetical protein
MKIPTAEEIYNDFHFNYKVDKDSILNAYNLNNIK